uniref:Uncharacterized protein n=1 Tax=Siphoviridae sp. ctIss5 TaxID=2826239 RepID=A0A8S5MSA7_9CAUD|nr:MAG TPA: hypothetical protein [Siphoviridae sp. ctIss5]
MMWGGFFNLGGGCFLISGTLVYLTYLIFC